jgi:hypothetical protein
MARHERRLTDPTADELVRALAEAAAQANAGGDLPLIRQTPEQWRQLVEDCLRTPEGLFDRAGEAEPGRVKAGPWPLLAVVWWTDSRGRRHWLVRGWVGYWPERPTQMGPLDFLADTSRERLPVLWHLCPERVFRRWVDGGREVLVCCSCGLVGTPEALAWAGDRCGPCSDRQQEEGGLGLPPQPAPPLAWRGAADGEAPSLVVSPDGQRGAVGAERGRIRLLDLAAGTEQTFIEESTRYSPVLAFSPDGLLLASATLLGDNDHTLLALWDGKADDPEQLLVVEGDVNFLAFLPDGRSVFLDCGYTLEVWEVAPGSGWRRLEEHRWRRRSYDVVALGGQTVALSGEDGVELVVLPGAASRLLCSSADRVRGLAFDRTGRLLAVGTAPTENRPLSFAVEVWDVAERKVVAHFRRQTGGCRRILLALSGDGATVATAEETENGTIRFWDVRTGAALGMLEGGYAELRALRFHPDGRRLITADSDGTVRLWPWRDLLGS